MELAYGVINTGAMITQKGFPGILTAQSKQG